MKRTYTVVALLTVTLIALEIAWTRVFSAEFFYPFAFLILSLAVLGLGLGALAVRLIPALAREERCLCSSSSPALRLSPALRSSSGSASISPCSSRAGA